MPQGKGREVRLRLGKARTSGTVTGKNEKAAAKKAEPWKQKRARAGTLRGTSEG